MLHLVLDVFSNSLPPPSPRGVEKLLALAGAAGLVAGVQPRLREVTTECVNCAVNGGPTRVLEYLKAAW